MEIFIGVLIAALAVALYIFLGSAKTDTKPNCDTCRYTRRNKTKEPCAICKRGSKYRKSNLVDQDLD